MQSPTRQPGLIIRIVVIAGTGLVGSKLVNKLREHGHQAVPAETDSTTGSAARRTGQSPHKQGPLSEGKLDGSTVTCPNHGAQFNVCTGAVLRGPAQNPLTTYRVVVDGDIRRVVHQ